MRESLKRLVGMGLATFVIALAIAFLSNSVLAKVGLVPAFLLLVTIMAIHVAADMIGTAATAAIEPPFHAAAANRVPGAREAIWLVRNADRVANLANDLVGDVTGTLSGAVGAAIILRVASFSRPAVEAIANAVLLAVIAAITVGGKAVSKGVAIENANAIIFSLGRFFNRVDRLTGLKFLPDGTRNLGPRDRQRNSGRKRD